MGFVLVTASYVAGSVLALRQIGYWEPEMAKRTVVWFLGTAIVGLFNTNRKQSRFFSRLAIHSLSVAFIVEFLSNLHTFPIYVELLLIPLMAFFVAARVVAESEGQYKAAATAFGWVLATFTLTSLSFSLAYAANNIESVTTEQLREFLLPFLLTLCLIPLLYLVALFSLYQSMFAMVRLGLRENPLLYPVTRRCIFRICRMSLSRAQLFAEQFRPRLWRLEDEAELTEIVHEFTQSWKERRAA